MNNRRVFCAVGPRGRGHDKKNAKKLQKEAERKTIRSMSKGNEEYFNTGIGGKLQAYMFFESQRNGNTNNKLLKSPSERIKGGNTNKKKKSSREREKPVKSKSRQVTRRRKSYSRNPDPFAGSKIIESPILDRSKNHTNSKPYHTKKPIHNIPFPVTVPRKRKNLVNPQQPLVFQQQHQQNQRIQPSPPVTVPPRRKNLVNPQQPPHRFQYQHQQNQRLQLVPPKPVKKKQPQRKVGAWSGVEDQLLSYLVKKHGMKWSQIAKTTGLQRDGNPCRIRWLNHLDPSISKKWWSSEEDKQIIQMHERIGSQWTEISKTLKGRPANHVMNHWNSDLRRIVEEARRKLMIEMKKDGKPIKGAFKTTLRIPRKINTEHHTFEITLYFPKRVGIKERGKNKKKTSEIKQPKNKNQKKGKPPPVNAQITTKSNHIMHAKKIIPEPVKKKKLRIKSRAWSKEEDQLLENNGKKWSNIPKATGLQRTGGQCEYGRCSVLSRNIRKGDTENHFPITPKNPAKKKKKKKNRDEEEEEDDDELLQPPTQPLPEEKESYVMNKPPVNIVSTNTNNTEFNLYLQRKNKITRKDFGSINLNLTQESSYIIQMSGESHGLCLTSRKFGLISQSENNYYGEGKIIRIFVGLGPKKDENPGKIDWNFINPPSDKENKDSGFVSVYVTFFPHEYVFKSNSGIRKSNDFYELRMSFKHMKQDCEIKNFENMSNMKYKGGLNINELLGYHSVVKLRKFFPTKDYVLRMSNLFSRRTKKKDDLDNSFNFNNNNNIEEEENGYQEKERILRKRIVRPKNSATGPPKEILPVNLLFFQGDQGSISKNIGFSLLLQRMSNDNQNIGHLYCNLPERRTAQTDSYLFQMEGERHQLKFISTKFRMNQHRVIYDWNQKTIRVFVGLENILDGKSEISEIKWGILYPPNDPNNEYFQNISVIVTFCVPKPQMKLRMDRQKSIIYELEMKIKQGCTKQKIVNYKKITRNYNYNNNKVSGYIVRHPIGGLNQSIITFRRIFPFPQTDVQLHETGPNHNDFIYLGLTKFGYKYNPFITNNNNNNNNNNERIKIGGNNLLMPPPNWLNKDFDVKKTKEEEKKEVLIKNKPGQFSRNDQINSSTERTNNFSNNERSNSNVASSNSNNVGGNSNINIFTRSIVGTSEERNSTNNIISTEDSRRTGKKRSRACLDNSSSNIGSTEDFAGEKKTRKKD